MDLKELEAGIDPDIHWYYQTKRIPLHRYFYNKIVRKNKKVTVLDIGAGSGFFSRDLYKTFPDNITRVELIDTGYTDEEINSTREDKIVMKREVADDQQNTLVIMMDVLEHIEDDSGFIKTLRGKLHGENHFFITVPAFKSLWSGHDEYLGHYRRYTRKSLGKLLLDGGFDLQCDYYLYGLIFIPAYILRKLKGKGNKGESDMKPAGPAVNFCLKTIMSCEMVFRKLNLCFGLTCVAEGR